MSDSFAIGAAARLVSVSPTAMRPEAGALIKASGVRSPMPKRFALISVITHQGHGAIGHRHLPWADHLIARGEAAHGTIADRNEKGFIRHGRQAQHAQGGFV